VQPAGGELRNFRLVGIGVPMMMMIAFITIKSGLVPSIEGLYAQIYCFRFEIIGGFLIMVRGSILWKRMRRRQDLSNQMRRRPLFLIES